MATYTPDSLRNLFQSSFNLAQWYSFLQHFFNATELKSTPERIIENTSDEGYYLGNIDTTDSYRIGLFQYNIVKGSVANKRVGLRNLVKSFINPTWGEFDAALVVFDSGDHWRLSFICDIKGESTSPKRYTYVFGSDDLLYRTPIERFNFLKKKGISFENLKTAFSVEALSDEFFDKYREQYAHFSTSSLSLIKRDSVFLSTLHILAIFRLDTPTCNNSLIRFSLPDNLYFSGEFFFPFGRPSITPSAFLRANASFVRWEIRLRSISADKPKAKAKTLLCISSPSL